MAINDVLLNKASKTERL